ncbi:hypothetical protein [Anaerocolumna xylanovorans]|uniref:Uncharacterized protein n=1 Tax=Anaerocolumna xylanovorans DSM 12503 TaxID=1121345 RepID=A0A1M7YBV3_9FIRM|nr:hypothetical protein [Anaerocolumna xylanovorans]SHO50071.1 hypothetical protein SAMN02745217_02571 [Anaerocolumna xylanovorans DSM 12503]
MTKTEGKVMYLGPTIRGVVKNGAVYEGGLPKKLFLVAEKKPIVKNLIVPLAEIVEIKRAIDQEGTAEAIAYDKISEISAAEIKTITEGE